MMHKTPILSFLGLLAWAAAAEERFWIEQADPQAPPVTADRASLLFVSSYNGLVQTFKLNQTGTGLSLAPIYQNSDCGKQPTWLNFDKKNGELYCLDEAFDSSTAQPPLIKFSVCNDGALGLVKKATPEEGDSGPVSTIFIPTGEGQGIHLVSYYG
jgi:hypothetical protein